MVLLSEKPVSDKQISLHVRSKCRKIIRSMGLRMELGEMSNLDEGLRSSQRAVPLGDQGGLTGTIFYNIWKWVTG